MIIFYNVIEMVQYKICIVTLFGSIRGKLCNFFHLFIRLSKFNSNSFRGKSKAPPIYNLKL